MSAELKTNLELSTVSIRRYITNDSAMVKLYGTKARYAEGTAWFYHTSTNLVTVMHNVEGMLITSNSWTELELFQADSSGHSPTVQKTKVRLVFSKKIEDDGIAVLELQNPFHGAYPLTISDEQPSRDGLVQSIGYVNRKLKIGKGKLTSYEWGLLNGELTPEHFGFNIESPDDPFVNDLGCSGAPIIDARGNVIAVLKSVNITMIGKGKDAIRAVVIGGTTCTGISVKGLSKY